MKTLVFGADGQLGTELCEAFACFSDVVPSRIQDFDMSDVSRVRERVASFAPDLVVNAAAFTDVDGAEGKPAVAQAVNADAVAMLGQECRQRRIGLVHYSTDFVFDGRKGQPYVETDEAAPLSVYGRSKLDGELALSDPSIPAIVLRTAWVYMPSKKSFVSSILRLARERESLRIVSDQVGNPTYAKDLATATALVVFGARKNLYESFLGWHGVYHVAGAGSCNRYEFAQAIVAMDPRKHEHRIRMLEAIASSDYPLPATRPLFAPLDCTKASEVLGIRLPAWNEALARSLQTLQ